jgi:hypothetical protein
METIKDVRDEYGNPRHGEVGGPPRSVDRFFGGLSVLKFLAALLFIVAAILIAAGVFTLIFPIAIGGFVVLVLAALVYLRARALTHPHIK